MERVAALRQCRQEEEAAFAGQWDRFSRSAVNPKPVQTPLPIGFGCSGPLGTRLAAQHADQWLPIDVALHRQGGVFAWIARFRDLVSEADRDPTSIPITLFVWGWEPGDPSPERLNTYAELDIERLVVCPPSMARHDSSTTLRRLDEFTTFLEASATA